MHFRDNELIAALLMLSTIVMAIWSLRHLKRHPSAHQRFQIRQLTFIGTMLCQALLLILLSSDKIFTVPILDVAVVESIVTLGFLIAVVALSGFTFTAIKPLARLTHHVSVHPQLIVASLITIVFWVSALSLLRSTEGQARIDSPPNPSPTAGAPNEAALDDEEPSRSTHVFESESDLRIHFAEGWSLRAVTEPGTYQYPSAMAVDKNGDIWVSDNEGLHRFNPKSLSSRLITTDFQNSRGLAFLDDRVFVTHEGRLIELSLSTLELTNILVDDLPHELYPAHSANGLLAINENQLLLGLGGTSDHGPELHEYAGSVMLYDLISAELRQYASGFRNPYDLTMCSNGEIYVSDNGPDSIDDTLTYRPPDELNFLKFGADYGYPSHFGNPPPWSDSEAPVALFGMSSAAAGVLCDDNEVFIALWGSLVIPEQTGKKIVTWNRISHSSANPGVVSDFVVGDGVGRPVDIAKSSNSLFWLDWEHGQLFEATKN